MWKKIFTDADLNQIAHGFGNSMLYVQKLRQRRPVLYWCSVVMLIAIEISPMLAFCLYFELNPTTPPESGIASLLTGVIAIIGIVASALPGISLVNEFMRLFHGYLGWKVTALGLLIGTPVAALCMWLLMLIA